MKKGKLFLFWFLTCLLYFFLAEEIIKLLFPGIYDVGIWISSLITGLFFITLLYILVYIFLKKKTNRLE